MRATINFHNEMTPGDRARKIENWAQSIPAISAVWAFGPQLLPGAGSLLELEVQLSSAPSRDVLETWTTAWSTILAAGLNTKINLQIVPEPKSDDDAHEATLQREAIFRR
jgi:hypothetical protein